MAITPSELRALIETEVSKVTDARVLNHIRKSLIEPAQITRQWDYGGPGQSYLCWAVLKCLESSAGIAYCEFGFGPLRPWGLINLPGSADASMGMDCEWFSTFIDAYLESAASELPIWRIFEEDGDKYPGSAISGEAGWESTWEQVHRLRRADPSGRYHCEQSALPRDYGF